MKKYINYTPRLSDIIVVAGGDGFMLKTLKRYQKYNKPFYGINRGTFGFLMNKFKSYDILKDIINTKQISISPLQVKVVTKSGKIYSAIAINEISLLRQSRQTASLQITNKNKILIKSITEFPL